MGILAKRLHLSPFCNILDPPLVWPMISTGDITTKLENEIIFEKKFDLIWIFLGSYQM